MRIRFTNHEMEVIDPPRALSISERSVLYAMAKASGEAGPAVCQIDSALVSAECMDRCGTVEFVVAARACPKLQSCNGPLAEAESHSGEPSAQTVLLFTRDCLLDYLETYRHDGQVPQGLPAADELTIWAARTR